MCRTISAGVRGLDLKRPFIVLPAVNRQAPPHQTEARFSGQSSRTRKAETQRSKSPGLRSHEIDKNRGGGGVASSRFPKTVLAFAARSKMENINRNLKKQKQKKKHKTSGGDLQELLTIENSKRDCDSALNHPPSYSCFDWLSKLRPTENDFVELYLQRRSYREDENVDSSLSFVAIARYLVFLSGTVDLEDTEELRQGVSTNTFVCARYLILPVIFFRENLKIIQLPHYSGTSPPLVQLS